MFRDAKLIGVFRISLRSVSAAIALSIIAGCGGGGGGGGSSNVSTSIFAVSVALKNLVSNGYTASFTVSGTLNGANLTGTGSETLTPGASSSFENQPAIDVGDQITYNLQWKGQTANWTDTYHVYFNQSSYAPTGKVDSSGVYAINAPFVWPSTARVGDSAALGSETYYSDSTKSSIIGSTTLNYSIEADTATTAILAITTIYRDSGNTISETDIDRYRVTPTGEITWVSRDISTSTGGSVAKFTLTAVSVNLPVFNTLPSTTPAPTPAPAPTAPPSPTSNPTPPAPTSLSVLSQSVAYQADPAHSGQIAFPAALNFPAAASWSVSLAGEISYPIVVNGTVYVTTAGNPGGSGTQLYALDVATGNTKWGPIQIAGTYPWSGIAYDNGKVFVINTDGMLRSFDAVTGAAGWAVKLPNQYMFSAPPTATKGIVYVGGSGVGGTLYAVNESSGSILWSASVMNGDKSSPAVSNEGVFVTYPCQGYDFDPSSGIQYWNFSNGCAGGGGRTPVYSNGKLFMRSASISNDNVVLDVQTGSQLWNFTASTIPAIGSSTGYFLSGTTLKAIDLTNQNQLWSFTGDGTLVSAPIILNSVVITASSSGKVFAVDAGTGAQVWSANIGAAAEAPDEQDVSKPLTGIGAGAGYLIVPAGKVLSAWYLQ